MHSRIFTAIAGEIYNVSVYAFASSTDNFGGRGMNGVVELDGSTAQRQYFRY
jgi:phage tail tube protein FII